MDDLLAKLEHTGVPTDAFYIRSRLEDIKCLKEEKGYSLASIYQSMIDLGQISCSVEHFRRVYKGAIASAGETDIEGTGHTQPSAPVEPDAKKQKKGQDSVAGISYNRAASRAIARQGFTQK
ncbi:MAG: hypothetical protein AAGL17_04945 [Cyanobacteria bacterium J06576_12]